MESDATFTFDVYLNPGEPLQLPTDVAAVVGPGHWKVSIRPAEESPPPGPRRKHSAFLNSYVPEDEGLYDDYPIG